MTDPIDLDALRGVLRVLRAARRAPATNSDVAAAFDAVAKAIAELTTSRARDAEVAELVAAARGATEERWHNGASSKEACDRLVAALLPFQRSDDKGDAT